MPVFDKTRDVGSPKIFAPVVEGQNFSYNGAEFICRGFWANADGTVNLVRADGSTMNGKQVFKGLNVFGCAQISALNGLSMEWFA